jgi:undecaprenyl-diphosphatase
MIARRVVVAASAALCLTTSSIPARAQAWRTDADDAGAAFVNGFALSAVIAISGLDQFMARHALLAKGPFSAKGRFTNFADFIGGRGPLVFAGALSVAGMAADRPRLERLGERTFRAVALGYAMSGALKGIVGRYRPNGGSNSRTFRPFRGFLNHEYAAFPSGHAATAFAAATVLATGVVGPSLTERRVIGGVAYAAATSIAISRISLGEHWVSDIIAGAALGVVAGSWVTHRAKNEVVSTGLSRGTTTVPIELLRVRF